MYNSNNSNSNELPSTKSLIKSTVIAFGTAAILLVAVVMPAEYGIDPTGVGELLGLKKMGEIKMSLAKEAAEDDVAVKQASNQNTETIKETESVAVAEVEDNVNNGIKKETISLTLEPDAGAEVKAVMKKGGKVVYRWESSGGKINFDVHGDSKKLSIKYHNYEKGSVKTKEGTIIAAFDGSHGWFWRNRTGETVTISLEVSGDYEKLDRVL